MAGELSHVAEFDWINYSVFFGMLLCSTLIGIYFAYFGKKQTAKEYLLGGKTMSALPVALSLAASHVTGTTLIGVPAEVYADGAIFFLVLPALVFVSIFVSSFFLPVFCNLQITSAYEYLELRYNRKVRTLASLFFFVHCFTYLPPMIYVPSIALSQVTGINLHVITVGVTAICVFYTMIGGIKAVIWTDFLQTVITIIACAAILIIGTINVGGFMHVMDTAAQDGKLDLFRMDPNPFQRSTFWTMTIGTFFAWSLGLASNQGSIQRFMAVPTLRDARKVLVMYFIGLFIIIASTIYGGLLLYVTYYGCDPVEQEIVGRIDQLYPYFVLDKIGYIPGLPGLFVAGVFSAALSSLSTFLNTLAGTVFEDYIRVRGVSEEKAPLIMKVTIVIIGILCLLLVFLVEKMGNILPITVIISSVTGAPVFAMFIFGMIIPFSNAISAVIASISSFLFLGWIAIGASMSEVVLMTKPIYENIPSTCPIINETISESFLMSNMTESPLLENEDDVFILYKLSYMYYTGFGIVFSLIVGLIVCYITGPLDLSTVDPKLISPPIRRFLPAKNIKDYENAINSLIDKKMETIALEVNKN